MEDKRGIIIEEQGKIIDIIFIDAKQDGGRKVSIIKTNCIHCIDFLRHPPFWSPCQQLCRFDGYFRLQAGICAVVT
ncbi:MAG: hypothetical protein CRN43_19710 [Candidatus Nephrothrix sp. EaCA]|nr:MAG: hypothetical protein CRN43_19710 [Candidatus Nephrothrix sp. EaCA]